MRFASDQYSIRLGSTDDAPTVRNRVQRGLSRVFTQGVEVLKTDYMGPAVGAELRRQALLATLVAMVGMLIYIAYRFEMSFAVGAIVANFHDIIVSVGIYLLCGHKDQYGSLGAVLTIVGVLGE